MKGADLVLTNSKVLGNLPSKENHHGIMVTKGAAKIENVSVENCDAAALRVIGGTVTAKDLAVNADNGIRGDDHGIREISPLGRQLFPNRQALALCQELYQRVRIAKIAAFVGIRGNNFKFQSQIFQDLLAARRLGCQYQFHKISFLF
jgi:hypothetical protein